MPDNRIKYHPILSDLNEATIPFYWQNNKYYAKPGEMFSSALIANGIKVFGHHPKDGSPQGIFCANGQCSQCMVLVNGVPVKSCMTVVKPGMMAAPLEGLPFLPEISGSTYFEIQSTKSVETDVLIIGAGPAGLSAAIELGKLDLKVLLIDDKDRLGGKLVLQTHRFFGSKEAVFAGTRGTDIAKLLESELKQIPNVEIWTNSVAVGLFEDKVVSVFRENTEYVLVKPNVLLVSTGAREKNLAFSGNTLPGIYGAGAFQTLVNRDLVKPCSNLFIVGGGNVGLIAGYHAIQAGIHVAGLVEAAKTCGGYKVHLDKLVRSGVPVYNSHTIIEALGEEHVEKIVLAEVDEKFNPINGTEKLLECDTILIAVGLDPVNEFIIKAQEIGMDVYAAGDAKEIAEASAAIFSGKITGRQIATNLGKSAAEIPQNWYQLEEILKSRPGKTIESKRDFQHIGVFPSIHCTQEIPCNPCATVCPKNLIHIDENDIRHLPHFDFESENTCIACGRCVAVCPGLAITLVDFRKTSDTALVTLPYEQLVSELSEGKLIEVTDVEGLLLGKCPIIKIKKIPGFKDGTHLITIEVPGEIASDVSGIRLIDPTKLSPFETEIENLDVLADDAYICRCERVTAGEIRELINAGVRDINQIKAVTKASMGACGGKTCLSLIKRMYQNKGIPLNDVAETPIRPLFVEIPISILANVKQEGDAKGS